MKYTVPLISLISAVAAGSCEPKKADNCLRAVIAGAFPERSASSACRSYLLTTVTPPASTTVFTEYTIETITTDATTLTETVPFEPTGGAKKARYINARERKARRGDNILPAVHDNFKRLPVDTGTTIAPTAIPSYATTACTGDISSRYSSACACIGVVPTTTIFPRPTVSETLVLPDPSDTEVVVPTVWVTATGFTAQFAHSSVAYNNFYVGTKVTSTAPPATTFLSPVPSPASAALLFLQPNNEITIGSKRLVGQVGQDPNNIFLFLVDPATTLVTGQYPVTCTLNALTGSLSCVANTDFNTWVIAISHGTLRLYKQSTTISGTYAKNLAVNAVSPV